MIFLVYEKDSGTVVSRIVADSTPVVLDHHATLEVEQAPDDFRVIAVEGGRVVERISPTYITDLKARRETDIMTARDAHLAKGLTTPLGTVQADLVSRTNLAGAALEASLNPTTFAVTWRTGENELIDLTAEQMIAIGSAINNFTAATYNRSFVLKDELALLNTVEAVKAFAITY